MEEEGNLLEAQLIQTINENLQNYFPQNASFLAEKLLAIRDTEENRNLLADCYIQENKIFKAYHILKDCKSEQNRYKLAVACMKLNLVTEAEEILLPKETKKRFTNQQNSKSLNFSNVPNGSYGLYLLGLIYEKQLNHNQAKEMYLQAINLNPTLWIAYQKLCKLGDFNSPPQSIFTDQKYKNYESKKSTISSNSSSLHQKNQAFIQQLSNKKQQGFQQSTKIQEEKNFEEHKNEQQQQMLNQNLMNQPGFIQQQQNFVNQNQQQQSIANKPRSMHQNKMIGQQQQQQQMHNNMINNFQINLDESSNSQVTALNKQQQTHQTQQQLIKSGNINIYYSPAQQNQQQQYLNLQLNQNQQQQHQIQFQQDQGKKTSNNFLIQQNSQQKQQLQQQLQQPAITNIITLLRRLAEPYFHMCLYQCPEAIQLFEALPLNQQKTGWVLSNIGRCYMEQTLYEQAEKYFLEANKLEPYRLEGIEYYSSCLWHLKKSIDLCYLANKALEKSMYAAETWIVVGNCFSLQKEHENALKFFNRAIQLNPNNAYAHSLCGLEYTYNEDFIKAQKCFDNALNLDVRLYNAWWGLGNVHYKQEKYAQAIKEFDRAVQINSRNPVLYTYLGMTHSSKGDYESALQQFKISEQYQPNNALNKFQKANALVKLEQYEQAKFELLQLEKSNPRESPIPVLLGNIYKKQGQLEKAHHYYTLALDLEPKDSQRIKGLIESLHHSNNEFNEDFDY